MTTADIVLDKIRELTKGYLVSRMPIRLVVLEESLQISRPELVAMLKELRSKDLVFFDDNYALLSPKGEAGKVAAV